MEYKLIPIKKKPVLHEELLNNSSWSSGVVSIRL